MAFITPSRARECHDEVAAGERHERREGACRARRLGELAAHKREQALHVKELKLALGAAVGRALLRSLRAAQHAVDVQGMADALPLNLRERERHENAVGRHEQRRAEREPRKGLDVAIATLERLAVRKEHGQLDAPPDDLRGTGPVNHNGAQVLVREVPPQVAQHEGNDLDLEAAVHDVAGPVLWHRR